MTHTYIYTKASLSDSPIPSLRLDLHSSQQYRFLPQCHRQTDHPVMVATLVGLGILFVSSIGPNPIGCQVPTPMRPHWH